MVDAMLAPEVLTPAETMDEITRLRHAGRMEEAAGHFAEDGVMVIRAEFRAVGRAAIRDGLISITKVYPVFAILSRTVIRTGSIALHHSRWVAYGKGPGGSLAESSGVTADVLRLQPDGRWIVLIDNPWGGSILDV